MQITKDNYQDFGIGQNFADPLYESDLRFITYGDDVDGPVTAKNPTKEGGATAYRKEPSYNRWWKIGPKGSRD